MLGFLLYSHGLLQFIYVVDFSWSVNDVCHGHGVKSCFYPVDFNSSFYRLKVDFKF